MKSRFSLICLVAVLFLFTACTKEMSKEVQGGSVTKGDFTATIGDGSWNADSVQEILASSNGVTITGISKTGDEISINLSAFQVGTYAVNSAAISYALYANVLQDVTNVYISNIGSATGSVTISSIDTVNHLVSGTFQFTLVSEVDSTIKTISKGVFSYVPYTGSGSGSTNPPPVDAGKDTLQALVGGANFFATDVESSETPMTGQLVITGVMEGTGTQFISFIIPQNVGAGTYNLDFATGMYVASYSPDGTNLLAAQQNGTLTVISNDLTNKRIKGNFSFLATPVVSGTPVNITSGYFVVSYQ